MLDEGVGPRVAAELLRRSSLPEGVSVLDRGSMGMALLSDLKGARKVLVVDAVDNTGLAPGTIVAFKPEDIASYEAFHGAHDTRLVDVLQAAEVLGYQLEVECLGVQIQSVAAEDYLIGLSPPVEAALPELVQHCLEYIDAKMTSVE